MLDRLTKSLIISSLISGASQIGGLSLSGDGTLLGGTRNNLKILKYGASNICH